MLLLALWACGTPGLDDFSDEGAVGARFQVIPQDEVRFHVAPQGIVVTEEVLLTNVGDTGGLVEDIWTEGGYADAFEVFLPPQIPGRLEPGDEVTLEVAFEVPAIGRFTADLYVSTPTAPTGGITRPLIGRGCEDVDHDSRCA